MDGPRFISILTRGAWLDFSPKKFNAKTCYGHRTSTISPSLKRDEFQALSSALCASSLCIGISNVSVEDELPHPSVLYPRSVAPQSVGCNVISPRSTGPRPTGPRAHGRRTGRLWRIEHIERWLELLTLYTCVENAMTFSRCFAALCFAARAEFIN